MRIPLLLTSVMRILSQIVLWSSVGSTTLLGQSVGYTEVFDDSVVNHNRYAMPFSMPQHGLIESVSMWHAGGGTGGLRFGVYVLMEKIKRDENRIDVSRLDPTHDSEPEITGGYIFKKDWERDFETDVYGDDLAYVYPAREDITQVQKDWLQNYLSLFEQTLSSRAFTDPAKGYAKFIDIGSWIDHHILVEIARNVDGYVLSTYLFKDRGGKLNMGPIWDYNGSLGGADYFCTYRTDGWHYEFDERQCGGGGESFPADNQQGYHWYKRIFADPVFLKQYADRWFELRSGVFSTANMLADIDGNVQLLTDHGNTDSPAKRNFRRWPVLNQHVWPNYKDSDHTLLRSTGSRPG